MVKNIHVIIVCSEGINSRYYIQKVTMITYTHNFILSSL